MRIHSHRASAEVRLLVALGAIVYAVAVFAAPAVHYADGTDHAPAATFTRVLEPAPEPGAPLPDAHEEIDCLFCQAPTHEPAPAVGAAWSHPPRDVAPALPAADEAPELEPRVALSARAPPLV